VTTTPEWVVRFPDGQLDEEGPTNHPCDEPSFGVRARAACPRARGPLAQRVITKAWWRHRSLPVRPLGVEH
jgi:hypothetical protein